MTSTGTTGTTSTTSTTASNSAIAPTTTTLPDEIEREIKRLLDAGEHAAAAAALRFHGQPRRAAQLYEQIFEHQLALVCFEQAGDVVAAVRVAITLSDDAALDRLLGDAITRGLGDVLLGSLQRAARHKEIGRVYLARGEHLLAARAFDDAGAWSDAARCFEELGNAREAGLYLERWLELHPDDDGAALRLGRILARFGRHDDAITLLQRAIESAGERDAVLCRAAPTLALAFYALGYEEAARATLKRWERSCKRLTAVGGSAGEAPPASLELLLSSARAAAFAAVQQTSARPPSTPPTVTTSTPTATGPTSGGSGSSPPVTATLAQSALLQTMAPAAAALFTSMSPTPAPASAPPLVTSSPSAAAVSAGTGTGLDAFFDEPSSEPLPPPPPEPAQADEQRLLLNGRYLLGEPLGGGGVGQVFRAHDAFADRPVAVKIFGAQVLASDAVQAWAREARAATSLNHPALVKLVELNMAQGFVVSELHGAPVSEGGDGAILLEDRLKKGGDGGWLEPMVQQVLDALSAAHRTGLVHGGLKPQNIFLLAGGVKLLDTGAHRLLALRSTETGGLASVWPYLSPQMLFGQPADVDGDLYALAAIIFRALTGRPPFSAATADRTTAPPKPSALNVRVPPTWDAFLEKALHPDPAQRFGSADEMLRALPHSAGAAAVTFELPRAQGLGGLSISSESRKEPHAAGGRYVKGALFARDGGVKTHQAQDAVVGRPVWLLEADDPAAGALLPFVAAARLWRGVQPVYDVLGDDVLAEAGGANLADGTDRVRQVVVAREKSDVVVTFEALRLVPQGLTRDLSALAEALTSLHNAGFAAGGFDVARAMGPVGPRLRLAPAPLLVPATPDAVAADWRSFEAVVDAAFDVVEDATLDARGRLLAALHDGHFLERTDLEQLAQSAADPWTRFLPKVTERLVAGAQSRVIARLVKSVIKG